MRDLTRPLDPDASGYARIMAVFGAVAAQGPMTLDETMVRTGIPRSACWRCLTTLEAEGWLSRALRDGAFRVHANAQAQVGAPRDRPACIEQIVPLLSPLARKTRIEADLAIVSPDGGLVVLETTRKTSEASEPFFSSPLTLGALMVLPPELRLFSVNRALDDASPDERLSVTSGRFTRALAEAASKGDIWDSSQGSLTVPIEEFGVSTAALRLEGQGSTKRSENKLRAIVSRLREDLPALFPKADLILSRHWPTRRSSRRVLK